MIVSAEPAFRTRHANPYNALLYDAVAAEGVEVREFALADLLRARPDIVHVHWPELMFLSSHRAWQSRLRLERFKLLASIARRRGTRVVWTVHNDGAHEARESALDSRLHEVLASTVDGVFTLSEAGEAAFRARFGDGIPVFHTPHGHYRDAYPLDVDRAEAREALDLEPDPTLLVAVGQIRPYKNLPALASVLGALDDSNVRLGIAGHPDPAEGAALASAAAGDRRVSLELARLDDERMALWLRAADAVVLPYRRILNSGAAILALSAGRPVIVPAVGAMPELQSMVGAEWVHLYEGELTPAKLGAALAWVRHGDRPTEPDLAAFEWSTIARSTIEGYRTLLDSPAR